DQALGRELLREPQHVLLVEAPAEPLAERRRELSGVALAVRGVEQRVHQRAELHHLPVRAADEAGAFLVARAVDVAEELDALRTVEGSRAGSPHDRFGLRI